MFHFSAWRTSWVGGMMLVAALVSARGVAAQPPAANSASGNGPAGNSAEAPTDAAANAQTAAPPVYWIGLKCQDRLNAAEQPGLLVEQVIAGAPAAKAGVQVNDLLLAVDDKPLEKVPDLSEAVNAAKDKTVRLKINRSGKILSIAVVPSKRPDWDAINVMPGADRDALQQWMNNLRAGQGQAPPIALRFFHPGILLPADARLPDDMSVSITRQGQQPAKITIKQGDKTWEVAEDKLSELPPAVRAAVEPLVVPRGMPTPQAWPNVQNWPLNQPAGPLAAGQIMPSQPNPAERLERRIEELNARLNELQKRLDRWEQQNPQPPATHERSRL